VNIRHGVMAIQGDDQRLLTRIQRSPERLYKLELKIAQPVSLSAHVGEDAWL
jgi:hypothetical protein